MYINGKAKLINKNKKYDATILIADIFDDNNCLKANLMMDIDCYNKKDNRIIEMQTFDAVSRATTLKCTSIIAGSVYDVSMKDIYIDADYGSGSIVRAYLYIEDPSSQIKMTLRK